MKIYIKAAKTIEDYENMDVFDEDQISEIRWGLEDGVDVSVYANPKYDSGQMAAIRRGLERGVDVSVYANPKYDSDQMFEIRWGLEKGLDVSVYANPKYDSHQMSQIRWGLEDGLDISVYADPKYDGDQMEQIWRGLNDGLDISVYADPKYDDDQMAQIRWGLKEGLDVSVYANPKYDSTKMAQIRKKLEDENKKSVKSSRINWKSFVNKLEQEAEDGIDSLYELTESGEALQSIQEEVENEMGIWLEPSIQAGIGKIWFYASGDNSTLASYYDYQTFNEDTIDMAINAKNKTEYKKAYKQYLEGILHDPEYATNPEN